MIDTHAHLDFEAFDEDREEMLNKAYEAGLEAAIIPSVEAKNFDKIIEIAERYDKIYFARGVHPHNASEYDSEIERRILDDLRHDKARAVGEIGLDYHYDFTPKDVQKKVFRDQLEIAKDRGLPAIVHNRESDRDLLQIIEEAQDGSLRGVLHCFSSGEETLRKALDLNFLVSFTGNITFKKSTLSETVEKAPLDKLMIETDSPFMTPVPHRGKRNDPSLVGLVAKKIAEIKSISYKEVIEMTAKNAVKFFSLFALILGMFVGFARAQTDDYYYEDDKEYLRDSLEYDMENPYKKFLGIGFHFGTSTIISTYKLEGGGDLDVSYDGILAYGGNLHYAPLEYLWIELAYIYNKNEKIVERADGAVEPSIYQFVELSTKWAPNPWNRVNIYGVAGYTAFYNSVNGEEDFSNGINTGLGVCINIPTKVGLFCIDGSIKVNFVLGLQEDVLVNYIGHGEVEILEVESTSYHTTPRGGIIWYPNLLK